MEQGGVAAVERALTILNAFSDEHPALTLHELSKRTGLYKSTLLRICGSLERHGYIRRGPDGVFRLGPTLWRLGSLYSRSFNLGDYVYPVLNRLVENTRQCATFYVRDNDSRLCLFRRRSPHGLNIHRDEGERLPLDRGAGGRIILAYSGGDDELYDQVRRDGYYWSKGELEPDVNAIAAGVFGAGNVFIGSLAISGLRSRFNEDTIPHMIEEVVREAAELTRRLTLSQTPSA